MLKKNQLEKNDTEFGKYYSFDLEGNAITLNEGNEDKTDQIKSVLKQNYYMNKFLDDVINGNNIEDVDMLIKFMRIQYHHKYLHDR